MAETIERSKTRVLVVDDEPNMRRTLSDILENEGYEVAVAATGEEAIDLCQRKGYEIVLMDVRMPGVGGVEAFRRIRRHQEGVRVILMSAYQTEDLKYMALDEGAIAFLAKPLDVEKTVRLIDEVQDTAILVVSSDTEVIATMRTELSRNGYRITVTTSPHDALEIVEQIRFDLIFLEADLPAMSGLDLYLAIKEITPTTTAVMIAGQDEEFVRIAQEAVNRNAYTIMRKPLDIDRILELLDLITRRRASDDRRKPQA